MKYNKKILILAFVAGIALIAVFVFRGMRNSNPNPDYTVGQTLDSLNGVFVYYNGSIENCEGSSKSKDGYEYGTNYKSDEFVKRYYYEYYKHKMETAPAKPEAFFDSKVSDGELNAKCNLVQFTNPSFSLPSIGDVLIIKKNKDYKQGHLAIVSNIYDGAIEVIQQNAGSFKSTRALFGYGDFGNKYKIDNKDVLGWLRIKESPKDSVSALTK